MPTPEPTAVPFELRLLLGVAADLDANPDATVPLWSEGAHDPDTAMPAGSVPIIIDQWPESIDCVTLADYTVSDDPSLSDSVVGVQVTIKAQSRAVVKAIAADVFNRYQGRIGGMLGDVRLVSSRRSSGTSIGVDSDKRQGRVENLYLTVHRPSAHRQ